MKQYLDLLSEILTEGSEKGSGRNGMPDVIGIEGAVIKMDLAKGFPLLTTKKMFLKGVIHELLWFLKGDTNIKYLVDNDVHIWDDDAYKWYKEKLGKDAVLSQEEFIEVIKRDYATVYSTLDYKPGDLGKVYGHQWRRWQKVVNDEMAPDFENRIDEIDQVANVIAGLKANPFSRYHIINAWNPGDKAEMALPPCHLLYQFIVRPLTFEEKWDSVEQLYDADHGYGLMVEEVKDANELNAVVAHYHKPMFALNLMMYQRSCDTFLGVPFNLASMSLLLMIVAKAVNMIPGVAKWIGGDVHIYQKHVLQVAEQLKREPKNLPKLTIHRNIHCLEDILDLTINDFSLEGYAPHPKIKAELFTGLKK